MTDSQGWIKLHRKLLDNALWKDCTFQQKVVMITLLLMANHEPKKWIFKGEKFECKAGQFITSLPSIQEKAGKDISIMQIRTCLTKFEKHGFLTCKSTNKNRLITIENWALYQNKEDDVTGNLTGNQQATNRQLTANKNVRMQECKNNSIKDTMYVPLESGDEVKNEKLNMKSQIDQVVKAWNDIEGLQNIIGVKRNTQRYKLLVGRLNEYGLDKVLECVHSVQHSSFLMGYTSENGWSAKFDWIIKPANFIKVLEGNYKDKVGGEAGGRDRADNPANESKSENKYAGYDWTRFNKFK